jgi:hypothetical protein
VAVPAYTGSRSMYSTYGTYQPGFSYQYSTALSNYCSIVAHCNAVVVVPTQLGCSSRSISTGTTRLQYYEYANNAILQVPVYNSTLRLAASVRLRVTGASGRAEMNQTNKSTPTPLLHWRQRRDTDLP